MKKLLFAGITKVYKTPSEQMLLEKWGWQIWSRGFPSGSVCKEPTCNAGDPRDMGSIPGLGRSLGGGHSNSFQYSCLENPMDRGAWQATVHRIAESDTTECACMHAQTHTHTHTHTHKICLRKVSCSGGSPFLFYFQLY